MSVARSKGALVGRRALAGIILSMTPWRLRCVVLMVFFFFFFLFQVSTIIGDAPKLGQAVPGAIASIAYALDRCHVSGCSKYSVILLKTVEIGLSLQPSQRTC